ncbi:zinc-ribbon domain-containing protein [Falsihalocynthiibacter sp. SS001]|uniref:zinc-ribbon domain-containing protein n=1 Tax=Falsihalocynthiibacter sp. SS001 TaxID=3349698 RepID=UPI0036D3BFE2
MRKSARQERIAMRLICPNCDAQYEVESRLIPESGRDVQCSSCGDTWFQTPQSEDTLTLQDDADENVFKTETTATDAPAAPPQPERAAGIDDALMNVLREEAQREQEARLQEGSSDTPLEDVTEAAPTDPSLEKVIREHTAANADIEAEVPENADGSRGGLLPDIEEINSTLDATSDRKANRIDEIDEELSPRRSGFRMGFSLIVVLVAVLLSVYSFAPQIGAKVPALDPALQTYVRSADQTRSAIDSLMESMIEKMNTETTTE